MSAHAEHYQSQVPADLTEKTSPDQKQRGTGNGSSSGLTRRSLLKGVAGIVGGMALSTVGGERQAEAHVPEYPEVGR